MTRSGGLLNAKENLTVLFRVSLSKNLCFHFLKAGVL